MRSHRVRVLLLAAAALLSCSRADRREAEQLVRAYDHALTEAYLTGSLDSLEKVTSKAEVDRVGILVGGLRGRHEVLLATLESVDVRTASLHADARRGWAVAGERWTYERVDDRTRMPTGPRVQREYTLRYELIRSGDRWVVDRVWHEHPSTEWGR